MRHLSFLQNEIIEIQNSRVLLLHPAVLLLAGDQGENLLGKGNDNAACHGEHAIGSLGGIVALEGQAYLQNTEAQQDEANGADERKNSPFSR